MHLARQMATTTLNKQGTCSWNWFPEQNVVYNVHNNVIEKRYYWPAASLAHSSSSGTGIASHQQQTAHPAHLWVAAAFAVLGHCPCYGLDCGVQGMLLESQWLLCSWHTVVQPICNSNTMIEVNLFQRVVCIILNCASGLWGLVA